MDRKELKSLIKEMVRESLTEIFVEMKLESIVESVVAKTTINSTKNIVETHNMYAKPLTVDVSKQKKQSEESKKALRESLMKKMNLSENDFSAIYGDIPLDNPIVANKNEKANPEFVSETQLEQMGAVRDYSKFF